MDSSIPSASSVEPSINQSINQTLMMLANTDQSVNQDQSDSSSSCETQGSMCDESIGSSSQMNDQTYRSTIQYSMPDQSSNQPIMSINPSMSPSHSHHASLTIDTSAIKNKFALKTPTGIHSADETINQAINQTINQTINHAMKQPMDESISALPDFSEEHLSEGVKQSIEQSINQIIAQSNNQIGKLSYSQYLHYVGLCIVALFLSAFVHSVNQTHTESNNQSNLNQHCRNEARRIDQSLHSTVPIMQSINSLAYQHQSVGRSVDQSIFDNYVADIAAVSLLSKLIWVPFNQTNDESLDRSTNHIVEPYFSSLSDLYNMINPYSHRSAEYSSFIHDGKIVIVMPLHNSSTVQSTNPVLGVTLGLVPIDRLIDQSFIDPALNVKLNIQKTRDQLSPQSTKQRTEQSFTVSIFFRGLSVLVVCNQSFNQSIDQLMAVWSVIGLLDGLIVLMIFCLYSYHQLINQSNNQSRYLTDQIRQALINQSVNQSISQSINQKHLNVLSFILDRLNNPLHQILSLLSFLVFNDQPATSSINQAINSPSNDSACSPTNTRSLNQLLSSPSGLMRARSINQSPTTSGSRSFGQEIGVIHAIKLQAELMTSILEEALQMNSQSINEAVEQTINQSNGESSSRVDQFVQTDEVTVIEQQVDQIIDNDSFDQPIDQSIHDDTPLSLTSLLDELVDKINQTNYDLALVSVDQSIKQSINLSSTDRHRVAGVLYGIIESGLQLIDRSIDPVIDQTVAVSDESGQLLTEQTDGLSTCQLPTKHRMIVSIRSTSQSPSQSPQSAIRSINQLSVRPATRLKNLSVDTGSISLSTRQSPTGTPSSAIRVRRLNNQTVNQSINQFINQSDAVSDTSEQSPASTDQSPSPPSIQTADLSITVEIPGLVLSSRIMDKLILSINQTNCQTIHCFGSLSMNHSINESNCLLLVSQLSDKLDLRSTGQCCSLTTRLSLLDQSIAPSTNQSHELSHAQCQQPSDQENQQSSRQFAVSIKCVNGLYHCDAIVDRPTIEAINRPCEHEQHTDSSLILSEPEHLSNSSINQPINQSIDQPMSQASQSPEFWSARKESCISTGRSSYSSSHLFDSICSTSAVSPTSESPLFRFQSINQSTNPTIRLGSPPMLSQGKRSATAIDQSIYQSINRLIVRRASLTPDAISRISNQPPNQSNNQAVARRLTTPAGSSVRQTFSQSMCHSVSNSPLMLPMSSSGPIEPFVQSIDQSIRPVDSRQSSFNDQSTNQSVTQSAFGSRKGSLVDDCVQSARQSSDLRIDQTVLPSLLLPTNPSMSESIAQSINQSEEDKAAIRRLQREVAPYFKTVMIVDDQDPNIKILARGLGLTLSNRSIPRVIKSANNQLDTRPVKHSIPVQSTTSSSNSVDHFTANEGAKCVQLFKVRTGISTCIDLPQHLSISQAINQSNEAVFGTNAELVYQSVVKLEPSQRMKLINDPSTDEPTYRFPQYITVTWVDKSVDEYIQESNQSNNQSLSHTITHSRYVPMLDISMTTHEKEMLKQSNNQSNKQSINQSIEIHGECQSATYHSHSANNSSNQSDEEQSVFHSATPSPVEQFHSRTDQAVDHLTQNPAADPTSVESPSISQTNNQSNNHSTKQSPFSLIILDILMPNMDGRTAASCIRQIESTYQITKTPMVACSANMTKADLTLARYAGFDYFLPKPFTRRELLECVLMAVHPDKTSDSLHTKTSNSQLTTSPVESSISQSNNQTNNESINQTNNESFTSKAVITISETIQQAM